MNRPKVYQTVGGTNVPTGQLEAVAGVGINLGNRWTSDKPAPSKAPTDQHSGAGAPMNGQVKI